MKPAVNHKKTMIPVVIWSTSPVSKAVMADTQGAPHFLQKPSCYKDLVAELRAILLRNGLALQ